MLVRLEQGTKVAFAILEVQDWCFRSQYDNLAISVAFGDCKWCRISWYRWFLGIRDAYCMSSCTRVCLGSKQALLLVLGRE